MSNIEGLNLFGKLTIKSAPVEETDAKKMKVVISENGEVSLIENSEEYDSVELSTAKKDEAENINEKQIKQWQQEAKMQTEMDLMKAQVIKDFAGEDPKDILGVLEILGDFKADFIENFPEDKDISTMAEEFKEALAVEYEEIKEDAKKNTKSAIKDRVIETILEEIAKDAEDGGRMLLGVVGPESIGISDELKNQITKELEKESEKYIKNYTGSELEQDLTNHLKEFLAETDKEKLTGATQKWEEDKEKIKAEQQDKNALRQMKESVKSFLVSSLMLGVQIELDGTVVRTEVAIPQILSRYEDAESLKKALDSAISQLSTTSRKDKLRGKTAKNAIPAQNNLFSFTPQNNKVNFFKL